MTYKKVVIRDCTLYNTDCMDILPSIGAVDAIVTDPPYGLAEKLQGGTWGKAYEGEYKDWDAKPCDYSKILPYAKHHIVWGGNYFILPPSRCWLVWNKPRRNMTMADGELAWCSWDGNLRIFDGYEPNGSYERHHPTQKHITLMRWCINQLPKDCETIMDCYMGSGTTGVACAKMGRRFIGIELDEKYFDIACKRIEEAYKQPDMFIEPPPKPIQDAML